MKLVMAISAPAVPGAGEAVRQAGRKDVNVIGLSLPSICKPYVHDGTVQTVVLWSTQDLGYLTASSLPADPSILSMLGATADRVLVMINAEVSRQAAMVAYIDVFHLMMLITIASLPVALLLRKTPTSIGETPIVME